MAVERSGRETAAPSLRRRADTRPPQCGNVQRGTEPHSGQTRDVGNSSIGHMREHVRSRALPLNPLARGYPISPDTRSHLRQCCARVRSSRSTLPPSTLTASHPSRAEPPHRTSSTKSQASPTDRRRDADMQVHVTSCPPTSRRAFLELSHPRYSVHRLSRHLIPSVPCFIVRTRSPDNTTYNSAPLVPGTVPNCLVPLQATDLPSAAEAPTAPANGYDTSSYHQRRRPETSSGNVP